jgi:hypothetical protein
MATRQSSTCAPHTEVFIVGFDTHDNPIQKTVAQMNRALARHPQELERTTQEAEPYLPLAQAEYLPADPDVTLFLVNKMLAAVRAREVAVRLADAVIARG